MKERERIGDYLIRQLTDLRVRHIFVASGTCPPDFSDLLKRAETIEMIEVGDENAAGFAADAYARVAGLGVVCVASGSGVLKVADSMAQAFNAQSPVVLLLIAPASAEHQGQPLARLHADSALQKQIIAHCTVAAAVIDSPATAHAEIDRVLATALHTPAPVAIEIRCDLLQARYASGNKRVIKDDDSAPVILQKAVDEAVSLINAAKRPVILAGVEITRFGLEDELRQLAGQKGIPIAVTLLARSVVADTENFFIGSLSGRTGPDKVRAYLEASDCLLLLGASPLDLAPGNSAANLDAADCICATHGNIDIKSRHFKNIPLQDFIRGLRNGPIIQKKLNNIPRSRPPRLFLHGKPGEKITFSNLLQQLSTFIYENMVIVSDIGDALSGARNIFLRHRTTFLAPAPNATLGFAMPAALGAQLASPKTRPLVLVDNTSFQKTGMEIAAIARYGLNPIIIVLNDRRLPSPRPLHEGHFHDAQPWHFSKIPSVIGSGIGFIAKTEDELELALQTAGKNTESFTIIDVRLDKSRHSALNKGKSNKAAESAKASRATGKKQD